MGIIEQFNLHLIIGKPWFLPTKQESFSQGWQGHVHRQVWKRCDGGSQQQRAVQLPHAPRRRVQQVSGGMSC